MATCNTDKFVITKNKDNEFIFTIKQDGSTLPMEIMEAVFTLPATSEFVPSYTETLGQDYIASVAEVLEEHHVSRFADTLNPMILEKYGMTVYGLVLDTAYTLTINGTGVVTVTNNTATPFNDDNTALLEIASVLSGGANTTNVVKSGIFPASMSAYVDANILYLTFEEEITTSSSSAFNLYQISTYTPAETASAEYLYVNGVTFSITGPYSSNYDALTALSTAINASADGALPVTLNTYVDSNKLVLEANEVFTVNGSDVFTTNRIYDYVAPVAGQPYIADYYTLNANPVAVDITSLIPGTDIIDTRTITEVKVKPAVEVTSINGNSTPDGDGWYTLAGNTTSLSIVPIVPGDPDVATIPDAEVLSISFTLDSSLTDQFTANLVELATGNIRLTKVMVVEDAKNGKVNLKLTAAETVNLTSERGSKVDRYYLLPSYKLIIDCVTANNGNFIAKVPEVYVD